jgi:hypothetical protein
LTRPPPGRGSPFFPNHQPQFSGVYVFFMDYTGGQEHRHNGFTISSSARGSACARFDDDPLNRRLFLG